MKPARTSSVESGGVRLAVYEEGDSSAPTVLLVHGYPDNSSVWRDVAAELRNRFHVVRYDVRGTGESGQPDGREGYRLDQLAADLAAVARAVSPDAPVHLVGHDWGSVQTWHAVTDPTYASLFASFTSISGSCLDHVGSWMRGRRLRPQVLRQLAHSWYIGAFHLPVLPELVWRARPLLARFHANYRDARNGLELYRANMLTATGHPGERRASLPVQQLALTGDPFVTGTHLTMADRWCDRLWRRELHTGHWAPRSHPGAVARLVTEFVDHLAGAPASRGLARARVGAPQHPFERQLVLVTGAASGIGRATALAFASEGADVLAVDLDLAGARRTAEEAASRGGTAAAYALDVADGPATEELAARVLVEHGTPDIVMANAGIAVTGPFLATSEEDWRRVVDVNLWGVVHTLRAFAPHLVDRAEGGHLVVTASMAGYFPMPSLPAYATTKAAVLMLAQCLSAELAGAGVGVSAICPGVVHTNITRTARFAGSTPEQERAGREATTTLYRRRGYGPERVARAVLRAVADKRLVVPVTPESRLASIGNRVSPRLVRLAARAAGRW
ncbi:SDR family oxidoreductase [Solihabitans fulvus]|uniref:SDR family oxidoreductase n=1 Tax=Solihabitans fulvus TaxID=1892852 RepID=A0A5B2X8G4_9PSEU|nr:SDR family oxidoreductase [Solihabitans fulvus]KAA2259411.1 SDR family oxidoreductase [Solihabitans fulvus]